MPPGQLHYQGRVALQASPAGLPTVWQVRALAASHKGCPSAAAAMTGPVISSRSSSRIAMSSTAKAHQPRPAFTGQSSPETAVLSHAAMRLMDVRAELVGGGVAAAGAASLELDCQREAAATAAGPSECCLSSSPSAIACSVTAASPLRRLNSSGCDMGFCHRLGGGPCVRDGGRCRAGSRGTS
jgi:hypothetical protein